MWPAVLPEEPAIGREPQGRPAPPPQAPGRPAPAAPADSAAPAGPRAEGPQPRPHPAARPHRHPRQRSPRAPRPMARPRMALPAPPAKVKGQTRMPGPTTPFLKPTRPERKRAPPHPTSEGNGRMQWTEGGGGRGKGRGGGGGDRPEAAGGGGGGRIISLLTKVVKKEKAPIPKPTWRENGMGHCTQFCVPTSFK